MRPITRITVTATILCLGLAVGGCADFDLDKVGDKLDVFGWTKKKPLPGDRKDVFPGGVPGVSQGVPSELMKGYQAPAEAAPDPAEVAAAKAAQAGEAAEKPKPKPKPKQTATVTPPKPAQQPQQATSAQQPRVQRPSQQQAPQQQAPQQAQAPWPSQQGQQQQAPQQTQSPWPSQQPTRPWPTSSQ